MKKRIVGIVAALVVLLAWVMPARAADRIEGKLLSIGIGGSSKAPWGRYREGCWIPLKVQLTNRTTSTFSGHLAVQQIDLDGDMVQTLSYQVVLPPSLDDVPPVWLYYWPRPDGDPQQHGMPTIQILDDAGNVVGKIEMPQAPVTEGGAGGGPAPAAPWILKKNYESEQSQRYVLVLGPKHIGLGHYLGARGGTVGTTTKFIDSAADLPDRALGLEGVDVLVWQVDDVHVSEVPAGFQLKAIQEWVRAGGQLVITSGRSQELKASNFGAGFLPMEVTGSREVETALVLKNLFSGHAFTGTLSQITGMPVADAVMPTINGSTPRGLVVSHNVGAGVVSLITVGLGDIDVAGGDPKQILTARQWLDAWQDMMGWEGYIYSNADVQQMIKAGDGSKFSVSGVQLDLSVTGQIDFESQTALRLGLAALFLLLYFVAAGPGAAAVLKYYKRTLWGWWIFGATVLAASALAVLVVWTFKLEKTDVKHDTVVIGTANGNGDVSIIGYYGVFAPREGAVDMKLPDGSGLSYLAPFTPWLDTVQSFADPQEYALNNGSPVDVKVPFRSTLKKMQGRWTGSTKMTLEVSGLEVRAGVDLADPLKALEAAPEIRGKIVNHTGYALHDIQVIVPGKQAEDGSPGIPDAIADVAYLKDGETADLILAQSRKLAQITKSSTALHDYIEKVGQDIAGSHSIAGTMTGSGGGGRVESDFLNVLLGYATVAPFNALQGAGPAGGKPEFQRQLTRLYDRSANLRAGRALVIAHAGDSRDGVASPIPLMVDGHEQRGSGQILFTWVVNP